MKRRNDVVVLLAGAIVEQVLPLDRLFDQRGSDQPAALLGPCERRRRLQPVEGDSRVAVGDPDQRSAGFGIQIHVASAQPPFRIGHGTVDDRADLIVVERGEHEYPSAR